jgi:hypothetical protein
MRRIAARVVAAGTGLFLAWSGAPISRDWVQTAVAQQQGTQPAPVQGPPPIDKFWVVSQDWHRSPGVAVADITFRNGNDYNLRDPVIACDFFSSSGTLIATRGSTVFQSFPPGKHQVSGIEFSLRERMPSRAPAGWSP